MKTGDDIFVTITQDSEIIYEGDVTLSEADVVTSSGKKAFVFSAQINHGDEPHGLKAHDKCHIESDDLDQETEITEINEVEDITLAFFLFYEK